MERALSKFLLQTGQDATAVAACRLPDIRQQTARHDAVIGHKEFRDAGESSGASSRTTLLSALSLAVVTSGLTVAVDKAHATWKPEYANAPQEVKDWYRNAQLTEAAQKRFGFKSCCAHSDVVKTEFRVDKASGSDEWYWLSDGQWSRIPGDIIHWGESTPDLQPTLFALGNLPTCFFPGQGGL